MMQAKHTSIISKQVEFENVRRKGQIVEMNRGKKGTKDATLWYSIRNLT